MSDPWSQQRADMIRRQLEARGIHDQRVLDAMGKVPREEFVPEDLKTRAYRDGPLPIGEGQTISQPYMVALMTEATHAQPHHKALEIGTGCGYQAAVLSLLVKKLVTVERIASLAESARRRLTRLGYHNVMVVHGDGTLGRPSEAPFDVILVTAGAPAVPEPLLAQTAEGGRLVIPVQEGASQILYTYEKTRDGVDKRRGEACTFVPLVGEHGWDA